MMRSLLSACLLFLTLPTAAVAACEDGVLLDHNFRALASDHEIRLCEAYAGQVLLVVNTASKCGNTPQYDSLEKMYAKYRKQGFAVLGFPSNDFLGQEPGTEKEIQQFCRLTYGVRFPMFEKTIVKGDQAHPFFKALASASDTPPSWNFQKYLIGRDGQVIRAFSPRTQPDAPALIAALEDALATRANHAGD